MTAERGMLVVQQAPAWPACSLARVGIVGFCLGGLQDVSHQVRGADSKMPGTCAAGKKCSSLLGRCWQAGAWVLSLLAVGSFACLSR